MSLKHEPAWEPLHRFRSEHSRFLIACPFAGAAGQGHFSLLIACPLSQGRRDRDKRGDSKLPGRAKLGRTSAKRAGESDESADED